MGSYKAGDVAQWVEGLLNIHEALDVIARATHTDGTCLLSQHSRSRGGDQKLKAILIYIAGLRPV